MSQTTTLLIVVAAIVILVGGGFLAKFLVDTRRNRRWADRGKRLLGKYQDHDIVEKIMARMIWKHMTRDQLFDSWGHPSHEEAREDGGGMKQILLYSKAYGRPHNQRVIMENNLVVGWDTRQD